MAVSVFMVVSIVIGSVVIISSIGKLSAALSATLVVDCISVGGAERVEAMPGGLPIVVVPVISVFKVIGNIIVVIVIGFVVWKVVASCRNSTRKLSSSALRSMN